MNHVSSITSWDLECMLYNETAEPKALPLSLLEEITDGFSDEHRIGRGGFAVVYKGKLENMTVAVKRMSNTYMYEKEFQREVECLMTAKHKNVVRFLGYCADTQGNMAWHEGKFIMADVQQRLLCFEYLPKGSLHKYITDMSRELRWSDRYQIITGICQGLHYLHQKHIVHLDLKPTNILLDENWVPKIADFGISRCFHELQSQVITKIAGTPGYLAPESFNHTEVTYRHSYRLDIYSLGVVIIEILTGMKGYHDVEEVVESWSKNLEKSQSKVQVEQVRVCAEIGIDCTNFDPSKRPDTQHIIDRLDETENMEEYIDISMIASQQINADMLNGTMRDFWFSYQQLNPQIKRCIEYCSIFPRGSKLRRDKLVCLWMAQGFVKTDFETEDMEAVAEGYIQELLLRSFLQPIQTSSVEYFTIDYELHDLLEKVARDCFRIDNATSFVGEVWEGDIPPDIQHLLIQYYDGVLITEKILRLKTLLTLIVYIVKDGTSPGVKDIESICKRLPKLRVLAIAFKEDVRIRQPQAFSIPESICQLKHMRYFSFRTVNSCRIFLPTTLNKLRHVQMLDFGDGQISEFNFGDLINIRKIFCCSWVKFSNISRLISLQTLPCDFRISNEQGYEIKQLRDLNKLHGLLRISGLENITSLDEAHDANLAAKERLTTLSLEWDLAARRCNPEVETKVLEGLCPPVGVQTLTIIGYRGSGFPDWRVCKQNGVMQQLYLVECGQLVPTAALVEAFPRLHVMCLSSCHWNALPGNMQHLTSLQRLEIRNCTEMRSLPTLPRSLQKFYILYCNNEFMKSCLTFGDPNWQKIEHVPQKSIGGLSRTARMQTKIWSGINRLKCL